MPPQARQTAPSSAGDGIRTIGGPDIAARSPAHNVRVANICARPDGGRARRAHGASVASTACISDPVAGLAAIRRRATGPNDGDARHAVDPRDGLAPGALGR